MARLLLYGASLAAAGCGYVGDPLPPLANIPAGVADLAAVQRGAALIVHFTPPQLTTEAVPIKQPLRFDLRIGTAEPPFNADAWAAAAREVPPPAAAGALVEYTIPTADWTGREVTLAVRAVGANGKAGGWSNFVNLTVAPPPRAPANVKPESAATGVRLTWQGDPGDYLVFRRALDEKQFTQAAKVTGLEWVDTGAEFGKPYTYLVQHIVPAGDRIAESELSPPVEITPRDTFPPAAPAGLRAVAGPQSIELTWDRSPEPDLAGYRVYRATAGGAFRKIADVSQLPAYSDHDVQPGATYRYAITAVDQSGNESAKSDAITVGM